LRVENSAGSAYLLGMENNNAPPRCRALPNQTLVTYGLFVLLVHGDALARHRRAHPEYPLWRHQAYSLKELDDAPARHEVRLPVMHSRLESPEYFVQALLRRASILKATAALLRYAYLADVEFTDVSFMVRAGGHFSGVRGVVPRSHVVEVRPIASPGAARCLLQAGDPNAWFDVDRWSQMSRPGRFAPIPPLSLPVEVEANPEILVSLGARRVQRRWAPPIGSSNSDLLGYLRDRAEPQGLGATVPCHA
jgi:hypothetical protein